MLRTLLRCPFSYLTSRSEAISSPAVGTTILKHILVSSTSFICACGFFSMEDIFALPLKLPFLLVFQDSRCKVLPPLISSSDLQRLNSIFLVSLLPKHAVSTFSIAFVILKCNGLHEFKSLL